MEAKNNLQQIIKPITTKPETRIYQSSEETQPGTNILTKAATEKIQTNKKYSYFLYDAAKIYNKIMLQKLETKEVKILCPEIQDKNDYLITTGWHDLNHDRVYNMYIGDILQGMKVYKIYNREILHNILNWYKYTNNYNILNQYKHYKILLTYIIHKSHNST